MVTPEEATKTGATDGGAAEAEVVAGGDAVEAEATASEDAVGADSGSGEVVETTVAADSDSNSSFSYKDSEETVSETRPEVGIDEVGPT